MLAIWVMVARAILASSLLVTGVLTIHELAKHDSTTQQVSTRK